MSVRIETGATNNIYKYKQMTINFKKLSENAVQPVRTANSGAGFNLTALGVQTDINERGQVVLVYHTGIGVEIPEGYEATIRPVPSIVAKTIRMCDAPSLVMGGIDNEICVCFITTTDVVPAVYNNGDIIAQIVFNKIEDHEFVEIVEEKKTSAGEGDQSLPETEDESTNSDTAEAPSGGEANIPEEA